MNISLLRESGKIKDICTQLDKSLWGDDNDMPTYSPESLQAFLKSDQNIVAVGKVDEQIVCIALGYALNHPDKSRSSLYIDELDTHPDHRRQGHATEMITWLRHLAAERDLSEIWLATEAENNEAANAFYASLKPLESLPCNLYTYPSSLGVGS